MIIVFVIGSPFINYFSSKQIHNPIRSDGPDEHILKKIGTPTMGGIIIFDLVKFDLNIDRKSQIVKYWRLPLQELLAYTLQMRAQKSPISMQVKKLLNLHLTIELLAN